MLIESKSHGLSYTRTLLFLVGKRPAASSIIQMKEREPAGMEKENEDRHRPPLNFVPIKVGLRIN